MGDSRMNDVVEEALGLLEGEPAGYELVATYAQMALFGIFAGAPQEALAWAQRSLDLAAELGLDEPVKALGYRGIARCTSGDVEGLADMQRSLQLSIQGNLGRDTASQYNNLGDGGVGGRRPRQGAGDLPCRSRLLRAARDR